MRRSKNPLRAIAKAAKIAELIVKANTTGLCAAAASVYEMVNKVAAIDARVFRVDGKMDKRRYRRYVEKHRKPMARLRLLK